MQIPGVCQSQGRFSHILCNKLPFWRPSYPHSYFIFIWLHAKCLQSDSNFIANNLRKKMSLRHAFHITQYFHFKLAFILDAILDISKCSMMPGWHHSDFSRTMYALPESTKKKSLKSSSRSS